MNLAIKTDQKITVAIYSGTIPSTTFIERLILGLSQTGFTILLFGKQTAKVSYSTGSIVVMPNRDGYPVKFSHPVSVLLTLSAFSRHSSL